MQRWDALCEPHSAAQQHTQTRLQTGPCYESQETASATAEQLAGPRLRKMTPAALGAAATCHRRMCSTATAVAAVRMAIPRGHLAAFAPGTSSHRVWLQQQKRALCDERARRKEMSEKYGVEKKVDTRNEQL